MNYALLYSTTLLVSLVLTLIFYLYHRRYWDPDSHVPLQCIYFFNMTSALMCVIWVLVDGKPELSTLNYLANIIEFNCMGYCGYAWLCYCLSYLDLPALKTRRARVLLWLPIGVVTLLILTTPFTHWAFFIDEGGFFRRGLIYPMQQTGYLYLCLSSVLCLLRRRKCTTSSERRRLSVLAMFPLSPALFGSVQILAPSGVAPTLQFSILISLILVFVDELDQKITRDSLTKLINRFEFERLLQNRMRSVQKGGSKLYVLMSDLDNFKSINDNYGHQQGDQALKLASRALAEASARHGAICARMSGDEFLSLLEVDQPEKVAAYEQDIQATLTDSCTGLPFPLRLSIGAVPYDGSMTLMELLTEADARMYQQKKLHKQSRSLS